MNAKEEDVIFPLADKHLPEALQRELTAKFEAIDKDVVGQARRQEFMDILTTLKEAYLE